MTSIPFPNAFPRSRSFCSRAAAVVLAAVLAAVLGPAAAAKPPYEEGEKVRLTGVVTDPAGRPLPSLHVVLEASRSRFGLRTFRREKTDTKRLTDLTSERGEYTLEWPWSSYYNTFDLVVGIPVRRDGKNRLRVLERIEVTRRIERGSPVVSAVVVEDAAYVANLRSFLATIRTEAEREVHQQMGAPDKVERTEFPDRVEVAWWYFEAGKVYRFRDGRLERIDPFEPVAGF